jgi:hypothetical protein
MPSIHIIPHASLNFDLQEYLVPSAPTREWFASHFYHCLPLSAANTLGWTLHNPFEFSVRWDGGAEKEGLRVRTNENYWPVSWFGHGVFTISPRFFVKTSDDVNLLARPVPNYFKKHVTTLEGMIETDWFQGGFTFNFKITEPNVEIVYKKGEPLVQLIPYPRGFIESVQAEIKTSGEEFEQFTRDAERWAGQRTEHLNSFTGKNRDFAYMRGEDLDGNPFPKHQKTISTPAFKKEE